jgi:hypothetical protein
VICRGNTYPDDLQIICWKTVDLSVKIRHSSWRSLKYRYLVSHLMHVTMRLLSHKFGLRHPFSCFSAALVPGILGGRGGGGREERTTAGTGSGPVPLPSHGIRMPYRWRN